VAADGSRAAWGSLVAGFASVAVLPAAVYLTRFSGKYDLLHAGFAIPVAAALGVSYHDYVLEILERGRYLDEESAAELRRH